MARTSLTLGAVGLAVAALVVPLTAAGATSATPTSRHASAAKEEHFTAMSTATAVNSSTSTVIATGAFTAGGKDHVLTNNKDRFKFPDGSFVVTHKGKQHITFNARKCLLSGTGHGTFVLSKGTGAYVGISGHGVYALSIQGVGARTSSGKCNPNHNVPPVAFEQLIRAHGKVSGMGT
jgi:hypothetical protein